jgi:hypothetical protein
VSTGEPQPEAVPGLDTGPDAQPGPLVHRLEVDGEVFAVRRSRSGGTDYDWVSGPNPGYGFGSSGSPDLPVEEHRRTIRGFLDMIDPATGYIADDD